jgi:hypothetical protein
VLYTALVERRFPDGAVERIIEPVTYDVNCPSGFSTMSEQSRLYEISGEPYYCCVVRADAEWEEIIGAIEGAESLWRARPKVKPA